MACLKTHTQHHAISSRVSRRLTIRTYNRRHRSSLEILNIQARGSIQDSTTITWCTSQPRYGKGRLTALEGFRQRRGHGEPRPQFKGSYYPLLAKVALSLTIEIKGDSETSSVPLAS